MHDKARLIALDLLYTPYIWGGNDPVKDGGVDCSGFLGYVLRQLGVISETFDATAQGYYDMFSGNSVEAPYGGCGAFYGLSPTKVVHCMLVVSPRVCIGGVRGNKWVDSVDKAKSRNARIDVRKIDYRKDLVAIVDLFKDINK